MTQATEDPDWVNVRVPLPNYSQALVVLLLRSSRPRRGISGPFRAASAALVSVVLAATLAACGSNGSDDSDVETRQVTDVEGNAVDVPVEPLRVVTLSEPTLDGALALGVTPVGTVAGRGQDGAPAYLADKAEGVPVLGTVSSLDYEKIAAADPDLILVDGTSVNSAEVMEILRRTAPTYNAGYAGGDWRITFENVAKALNKDKEGAAVVADYQATVDDAKAQLGDRSDERFSIVRWQGGSASLILKELPSGMALEDLGLRRPASQDRRGRGHSEPVSLENLSSIDADHMFFGTLGGSSVGNAQAGGSADVSGARTALEAAEKVPGFSDLEASRTDSVHLVDGSLWTSTGGPLLMQGLVASVVEALA